MKMRFLIVIFAACLSAFWPSMAQRTTRPGLKLGQSLTAPAPSPSDTISASAIRISGYEKTLKSAKESLLCTNLGADTISAIEITIEYLDTQGRQIHKRDVRLNPASPLPPGQTRMLEFKSWDSQRVWHYRLSPPSSPKGQATPYDVKVSVAYALKNI